MAFRICPNAIPDIPVPHHEVVRVVLRGMLRGCGGGSNFFISYFHSVPHILGVFQVSLQEVFAETRPACVLMKSSEASLTSVFFWIAHPG
jgi:hypothetical protein